jgi:SpoVK/Ycf46/Vps4 family AAA+-type ATPase
MDHDPIHDVELLVRSRYGALLLDTGEEDRAEALVSRAAARLALPLFVWRRATGLRRTGETGMVYGTQDPRTALDHIAASDLPGLYLFYGLGPDLARPEIADLLREAAGRLAGRPAAILITGDHVTLPESLQTVVGEVHIPVPTRQDYESLLERTIADASARMGVVVALTPADRDHLLANLRGLALSEAERLLTRVMVEDGRLDSADIARVAEAKRDLVERDGLLEYIASVESLDEIAGLANLKSWLEKRRLFMQDPGKAAEFGLEFPRGVLLVGVPGCGKSLCAKAVATAWSLPLVRLDPGALYDKYIGETEARFRKAMGLADRLAPLILWIDELEKAFAAGGADQDGGTSQRVLGTFLSWLQERRGDVFVVATANDVERLPAELLRKGRFDETFFVDLPGEPARAAILAIHLRKRKQRPEDFDVQALARESGGYSGAELEQVVVSALYTAFAAGRTLTTALLLDELRRTPSIASTARERIAFLRQWATGRTVPAD